MIESIGKKRRGRKSIIDIGAAVEIDVILVAQAPVRPQHTEMLHIQAAQKMTIEKTGNLEDIMMTEGTTKLSSYS